MTDVATLRARLAEAEEAYHKLAIGEAARVFVDQNGERVEYVSANRSALMSYISELKRLLGETTEGGPLNVWL